MKQITENQLLDKCIRTLEMEGVTHLGASDCLPIIEESGLNISPDDTHERPRQYRKEDVGRAVAVVLQERKVLLEAQSILHERQAVAAEQLVAELPTGNELPVAEGNVSVADHPSIADEPSFVDAHEPEKNPENLPSSVWTVLRNAGFKTIEEIEGYVAEGNEIASIRGLGPARQRTLAEHLEYRLTAS